MFLDEIKLLMDLFKSPYCLFLPFVYEFSIKPNALHFV